MHEGSSLPDAISLKDIEDDRYLKPVLDDDALILCLDDLPEPSLAANVSEKVLASAEDLFKRNVVLQSELEALAKQFNNYRLAVQQTLDTRWAEDDSDNRGTGTSREVQPQEPVESAKDDKDYSESYFASYARNGRKSSILDNTGALFPNVQAC